MDFLTSYILIEYECFKSQNAPEGGWSPRLDVDGGSEEKRPGKMGQSDDLEEVSGERLCIPPCFSSWGCCKTGTRAEPASRAEVGVALSPGWLDTLNAGECSLSPLPVSLLGTKF